MDEMESIQTEGWQGKILTERQCFSRIGMAYFILTVLTSALQALGGLAVFLAAPEAGTGSWQMWVASFLPMYGIAVPVCAAMMRRVPSRAPETHSLGAGRFGKYFLMSIGILYAGNLIGVHVMNWIGLLRGAPVDNSVETLLENSSLLMNFLVTALIAPIIEEFLFRKLLIDRTRQFGEGLAVVLSGLLFGLFHANLYQFFYAFGLGMLFAYLYIRTGRLRYPIALHMLINFMGAVLAPLVERLAGQSDITDPFTALQLRPQLFLVTVYGMALFGCAIAGALLLLLHFRRRILLPGECPLPRGTRLKTIFVNTGMILFLLSIFGLFVYYLW